MPCDRRRSRNWNTIRRGRRTRRQRMRCFTPAKRWCWGDAGYRGRGKRVENKNAVVDWETAMTPGRRRALDKAGPERRKASVLAEVEHRSCR